MLERVPGYLELLDRHGLSWRMRREDDPGRILYEDDVQVVVAPHRILHDQVGKTGQIWHVIPT